MFLLIQIYMMKNLLIPFIATLLLLSIGFSEEKPKNLQILDFESMRALKKYMKTVSKDIGEKCTFCHDMNDKSIDTEHKLIAREMMKMQKNLNKSFFAQIGDSLLHHENVLQISCWTCHRGSKNTQLIQPKK